MVVGLTLACTAVADIYQLGGPLTRVGEVTPPGTGLVVRGEDGAPLPALPRAFDHFAAPSAGQGGCGWGNWFLYLARCGVGRVWRNGRG